MRRLIYFFSLLAVILPTVSYAREDYYAISLSKHPFLADNNESTSTANTTRIALRNLGNVKYVINGAFDGSKLPFQATFDTSTPSSWVSVNSDEVSMLSPSNLSNISPINQGQLSTFTYQNTILRGFYRTTDLNIGGVIAKNHRLFLNMSSPSNSPVYSSGHTGVIGLGLSNPSEAPSLLDSLKTEGKIGKKIMGIYLEDNPNGWNTTNSEIIIGGVNPSKFSNEIKYFDLAGTNKWEIPLKNLTFGELSLISDTNNKEQASNYTALVDSSSSNLLLPRAFINKIISYLKYKNGIICLYSNEDVPQCLCPLNELEQFPDIIFAFQNETLTLRSTDYVERKGTRCELQVNALESYQDETQIRLGEVFMRSFYTVLNAEKMKVGFAPARHPGRQPFSIWNAAYIAFVCIICIMIVVFFLMLIKNLCDFRKKENEPVFSRNAATAGLLR